MFYDENQELIEETIQKFNDLKNCLFENGDLILYDSENVFKTIKQLKRNLNSLKSSVNSYILETCINSIEYSERQKQIKQVEEEKIDFKKL